MHASICIQMHDSISSQSQSIHLALPITPHLPISHPRRQTRHPQSIRYTANIFGILCLSCTSRKPHLTTNLRIWGQPFIFRACLPSPSLRLSSIADYGQSPSYRVLIPISIHIAASILGIHKPNPNNAESPESLFQCMVVWEWLERAAWGWRVYGIRRHFYVQYRCCTCFPDDDDWRWTWTGE